MAHGENYFSRKKDEQKVWRKIKQGNHLLLLAPRRVGKSSLLQHLKDNPDLDYVVVSCFVQAYETEKAFYKKLLKSLQDSDFVSKKQKVASTLKGLFDKFQINLTLGDTVKVETDNSQIESYDKDIVQHILLNGFSDIQQKVLITIDEFPDVLECIARKEGNDSARQFLAGIRELCQDVELSKKVQFIFTGSIGLNTLAEKLQMTNLINTLKEVTLDALSDDNAKAFIQFYCDNNGQGIVLDDATQAEIIKQVGWNMPYYLALVCEELIDKYIDTEVQPTKGDVTQAIDALFDQVSCTNFSHWKERLNRFEKAELNFTKRLLTLMSENNGVSYAQIFDLSQHTDFSGMSLEYVLNCLKHDGYIFRNKEEDSYYFTSPLLKKWWQDYGR